MSGIVTSWCIQPFADYSFMRRSLAACLALSLSTAPLGVFLVLRRMTLMGDALSHALLPGVGIAFFLSGGALAPMTFGGLLAGALVTLTGSAVSRATPLKEDASFTGAYLIALAAGVLLISMRGSAMDLMHILFGNALGVDREALLLVTGVASVTLPLLAMLYRGLVLECVDPQFLRTSGGRGGWYQHGFLLLVTLNLVAAFQALGTLMALGLMLLPAIAARFWTQRMETLLLLAIVFSGMSAFAGLVLSYQANTPSGPTIVLTAGAVYLVSLAIGTQGGMLRQRCSA